MANTKISALPEPALLNSSALIPIVQDGVNNQVNIGAITSSDIMVKSMFGAKGDGIQRFDGSVTGTAFTSALGTFTADDVGKVISITGAGTAGYTLTTTIAAVVSATAVTLATSAPTSGTNRPYVYGTDDTAAIQAAVDAAGAAGGGNLVFDDGIYIVNGPLQDTSESNAQIVLPKVNTPNLGITVRMKGRTPPLTTWGSNSGAILQSTLTAGNGQMIGVKNTHDVIADPRKDASWVAFYTEDITLRMVANPTNSCIDGRYIPIRKHTNTRIDVVSASSYAGTLPLWVTIEPTTTTSYAIKGGANDIPLWEIYDNVMVAGFYTGVLMGELWTAYSLAICSCKVAMEMPEHRHPGIGLKVGVYNCPEIIRVTGTCEVAMTIDTEHNTASGSGPSWVTPFVADINDPNNYLKGTINFHMHDTSIPLVFIGAGKVHIRENSYPHSSYIYDIFSNFRSSFHHATVARAPAGKYAYNILSANDGGTAGFIGFLVWANEAITAADKRVSQIYSQLAGALNSGKIIFQTSAAGTLADRWEISHLGHLSTKAAGIHLAQSAANGDLAGIVSMSAESTKAKTFATAFINAAPAVVLTPQFDVGLDVRFWVTVTTSGFTINTSAPVTGTFSYQVIGNPY